MPDGANELVTRDPLTADILPSSVARETKRVVVQNGLPWVPIFCANCGRDGGMVPEPSKDFAFYLCDPCGEKWSPMIGTMVVPQERFWETARQEQLERLGREMTDIEVAEAMRDPNHWLWPLVRSEASFMKRG